MTFKVDEGAGTIDFDFRAPLHTELAMRAYPWQNAEAPYFVEQNIGILGRATRFEHDADRRTLRIYNANDELLLTFTR